MKLWDYLDTAKLEEHIKTGLVDCRYHKEFNDLMILSYGKAAAYDNVWDDVTTRCRGLIVNFKTGDIVARPFEKFFNIMTHDRPETHLAFLPDGDPLAFEKLDGSLGILYTHNYRTAIASKGSFHSEHAEWATNWYHKHVLGRQLPTIWPRGCTPIFEMICESVQHHVVHYGWEGLVLLAIIENETGAELGYKETKWFADYNGFKTPKVIELNPHQAIRENRPNEEGYVLTWFNTKPPFRVKVKFADFLKLQRIVHNATPKTIFEALATGNAGLLDDWRDQSTPHIAEFIQQWKTKLTNEYFRIHKQAAAIVQLGLARYTTRKEFAEWFLSEENKPYSAICFAMLDQKDYGRPIWKMIEPTVKGQKAFLPEEELVA